MNKDSNFDVFKNYENYYEIRLNITGDYMCETDTKEKAEAIVKALEKQIPKTLDGDSVEDENFISGTTFERKIKICPICKNIYVRERQSYCGNCGQKLDWK